MSSAYSLLQPQYFWNSILGLRGATTCDPSWQFPWDGASESRMIHPDTVIRTYKLWEFTWWLIWRISSSGTSEFGGCNLAMAWCSAISTVSQYLVGTMLSLLNHAMPKCLSLSISSARRGWKGAARCIYKNLHMYTETRVTRRVNIAWRSRIEAPNLRKWGYQWMAADYFWKAHHERDLAKKMLIRMFNGK